MEQPAHQEPSVLPVLEKEDIEALFLIQALFILLPENEAVPEKEEKRETEAVVEKEEKRETEAVVEKEEKRETEAVVEKEVE